MCGPHHCLGRDAFASGPELLRRLLQLRQNASILEQGCTSLSPNSANRKHQITRHPWRTSPPLRPSLSFRYTQGRDPASMPITIWGAKENLDLLKRDRDDGVSRLVVSFDSGKADAILPELDRWATLIRQLGS